MSDRYLQFSYHVGGSVPPRSQTYVRRQADEVLFTELLRGEFCYVFNSRQMGKSSLRVQVMARLREAGVMPGALDLTAIGTQQVTVEQWYAAIAAILSKQFQLKTNLRHWWRERLELPPSARLGDFIAEVLLAETEQPLVILIDEIDSILALKFATDDFFALIRSCYNRRADQPEYRRLSFALFGVTTPGELIADKNRTPFNIGKAIALRGFQSQEAAPLVEGLAAVLPHAERALERILYWSGGQPFLMQKLCRLVVQRAQTSPLPPLRKTQEIDRFIDGCVEQDILHHWEAKDEPEHLKTIRDRLLYDEKRVGELLTLYRQVWDAEQSPSSQSWIPANECPNQTELILSGVVEKRQGYLRVKNPIYDQIFDHHWIDEQLNRLRPYASLLNAWIESNYQDESRLLRGKALQDALEWTQQKGLGDLDYRYLSASQDLEQRDVQAKLERARLEEAAARLEVERRSSRRQRRLLAGLTVALVAAIALGIGTFRAYQQAAVSEIQAMMAASRGSFASNQQLDALIQALQARESFLRLQFILPGVGQHLNQQTHESVQRALYGNHQVHRIAAHSEMALGLDFSPDGQWIATSSIDETVKIWSRQGILQQTLNHSGIPYGVAFSPDSQFLAAANFNHDIYIWSVDGQRQRTLKGHQDSVWDVAWSPDGRQLVSVGADRTVRLWSSEGELLQVLEGHQALLRTVAFHPQGGEVASMSVDGEIRIWGTDGELRHRFTEVSALGDSASGDSDSGDSASGLAIAYSPEGDRWVTGHSDHTVRLWQRDQGLIKTLRDHDAEVATVAFSPDGQQFASAGVDRQIKLWSREGTLLKTFRGHNSHLRRIAFNPEGTLLGSLGEDGILQLWQIENPFRQTLSGHDDVVWGVQAFPDSSPRAGQMITISGMDIRLWDSRGVLLKEWQELSSRRFYSLAIHPQDPKLAAATSGGEIFEVNVSDESVQTWQPDDLGVLALDYSPDGRWLVSGGVLFPLKIWTANEMGQYGLYHQLEGHQAQVWNLQVSPDGSFIISGDLNGVVHLWEMGRDNQQQFSRFPTGPSQRLQAHDGAIWGVAVSPDSQQIAAVSREGWLTLWTRQGELIKNLRVPDLEGFTRIAWSADGRRMALGRVDGMIDLYTSEGEFLSRLVGHESEVTTVAFSRDHQVLLSGGQDGLAIRWDVERILEADLMDEGCDRVWEYLRYRERKTGNREQGVRVCSGNRE
jgi:WD40 repeat protein